MDEGMGSKQAQFITGFGNGRSGMEKRDEQCKKWKNMLKQGNFYIMNAESSVKGRLTDIGSVPEA